MYIMYVSLNILRKISLRLSLFTIEKQDSINWDPWPRDEYQMSLKMGLKMSLKIGLKRVLMSLKMGLKMSLKISLKMGLKMRFKMNLKWVSRVSSWVSQVSWVL